MRLRLLCRASSTSWRVNTSFNLGEVTADPVDAKGLPGEAADAATGAGLLATLGEGGAAAGAGGGTTGAGGKGLGAGLG